MGRKAVNIYWCVLWLKRFALLTPRNPLIVTLSWSQATGKLIFNALLYFYFYNIVLIKKMFYLVKRLIFYCLFFRNIVKIVSDGGAASFLEVYINSLVNGCSFYRVSKATLTAEETDAILTRDRDDNGQNIDNMPRKSLDDRNFEFPAFVKLPRPPTTYKVALNVVAYAGPDVETDE